MLAYFFKVLTPSNLLIYIMLIYHFILNKNNTIIFTSDSIAGIYLEWVEDYDPIFKAYEQSLSYWKMGALRTKSVRRLSPLVMGFDVRIGMQSFTFLMAEIC